MRLLDSSLYVADLRKALVHLDLDLDVLNGKTVLITGGLGLIASTVVDVLFTYGRLEHIIVAARDEQQFNNRFGGCERISFSPYDALSPLQLHATPDYIIHAAGLASPQLYTAMPVETVLSNIDGIHNLLKFAQEHNVERVLYVSSSEVYGNKKTLDPFREGEYGTIDIDSLRSSYAIAKRAAEMLCKAYSAEYDVDAVIVRPGHIYGPSAKPTDQRISSDFAYKAARGEHLVMKSPGLQQRSYCYSIECAMQLLIALIKGEQGQAYNIGHNEVTTIRSVAEIYAQVGNTTITVTEPTPEELAAFSPMNNSSLDNTKIQQLGYHDIFTVQEGLTHTIQILKEIM